MTRITGLVLNFILFLVLQKLLFNSFTLWGVATPFVFLVTLLMLPLSFNFAISITLGFFAGLLMDIFSQDFIKGGHSFACVMMMAIRVPWISLITTRNAFKGNEEGYIRQQPLNWYMYYFPVPILVHHFAYFLLDAAGFSGFGGTLLHTFTSAIYTFVLIMAFSYLFFIRQEKR